MKILTKRNQKKLLDILMANQIIFNEINSLDGLARFEAYGKFCENNAEAIYLTGGINALNNSKECLYPDD